MSLRYGYPYPRVEVDSVGVLRLPGQFNRSVWAKVGGAEQAIVPLAVLDISAAENIDSFTRAVAAGYTGSGDATAMQREADVDELRIHYVGGVRGILLEDTPSPCELVAPGTPSVTPGEEKFSATFTAIPITASRLRYEYRLDGAGAWTSNGTSTTLTDIAADAGDHVLNVRAVSTSGVEGATATSASFTVTAPAGGPDVYYDSTPIAGVDDTIGGNSGQSYYTQVVVAAGGTGTKLRFKVPTAIEYPPTGGYFGGSETVKSALFDGTTQGNGTSTGSLQIGSGTVSANAAGVFEVTISVPPAMTAKTYTIGFAWGGASVELSVLAGVSTVGLCNTVNYAAFPTARLPTFTSTSANTLFGGVYVD